MLSSEYLAAFGAGLISFLSPCVLPLVPAYLSVITGVGITDLKSVDRPKADLVAPALLFVAGFSLAFIALGASASILGAILAPYRDVLSRVAGVLIVLMGILMLGIVKVPWMYGELRMDMSRARSLGRGAAFVMGLAFALGWTPCVGPILASILALAGSSTEVSRGAGLLLAYAVGLGAPFVLVAALFGRMEGALRWLNRRAGAFSKAAGVLLIVMGMLVVTGQLTVVSAWLLRVAPWLRVG